MLALFQNVEHKTKFRSKKGQLPFVELNGEEIADSAFIIKELSEKFSKDLDASLTPEQRVVAYAMSSMIENHLAWVVLWWRAKYPDSVIKGYQMNLQSALNTRLPNPILNFCYKITSGRKGMKKAKAHGIAVHSQDEIIELGKNDLRALSELLGDKPFMFGNEPTLLDVVAFANLAQLHFVDKEVQHALRDVMHESFPNLAGLVARVRERAFPDWGELCAPVDPAPAKPKEVTSLYDTYDLPQIQTKSLTGLVKESKEAKEGDAPGDEKEPEKEREEKQETEEKQEKDNEKK
ncbi:Failed axon connections protein [Operophtera brumata]|uniref:Failed axon connections protein n=1 Tax=Operophtera brumata TaxID=104452 RepID=A0A0L7LVX9_OPEBR|nr:Failed axon connections protein [Operophtera brumata]